MNDYFTYISQRAQHDLLNEAKMSTEGIEYYEKQLGKEQVEKDYQAALNFWQEMEAERLTNIQEMSQVDDKDQILMNNHNEELDNNDLER